VNPEERNLVVSRRDLLEKEREEARAKLWAELAEGQIREGIVRSVRDFGAFVDLGGVDGLLHISEMSWSRVQDASQVVQPGQAVKVIVLKLDRERRKVSLGLRQLTPSPWDSVDMNYPPNSIAKGKVTRLMDFGAFVELEPGVEGLVHISELAPQRVRRVADIVQVEQEVRVMVLAVDRNQRRISLSLKAAMPEEAEEPEEEEEQVEIKRSRPRTTPLRGGLGDH
jgi:small subunit ribosomal protein S1